MKRLDSLQLHTPSACCPITPLLSRLYLIEKAKSKSVDPAAHNQMILRQLLMVDPEATLAK